MKVLQINCVYREGSTGKIMYDIHTELQAKKIESVVCYGRGGKRDEAKVYKTCSELYAKANNLRSRLTGLMYGGCFLSTRRLIGLIKKEKPDIVHLHCINGYFVNIYRLITWLKKSGIPTVLTLHAEFLHTGNCGHALECEKWKKGCHNCPRWREETRSLFCCRTHTSWKKMRRAFEGFEKLKVVSVSPWLMDRAKQSPILSKFPHTVIFNGVDTKIFRPYEVQELKRRHAPDGKRIVLYVTADFSVDPSHLKGGYYALELARRLKDTTMLVAAGHCSGQIDWPDNVTFLGKITDQQLLAQYYSLADVCLVTSKRETFSMPTAESLCCGTPLVGFEAGAPEAIALREHSSFVAHGDLASLEKAVHLYLNAVQKEPTIAQKAAEKYAKETMAQQYIALYKEMLK